MLNLSPCNNSSFFIVLAGLNHEKSNEALLPAEADEAPPAGHQMQQSTPVITESVSQPALPQLETNGHLLYVDTIMNPEKIHWKSETLENMQKMNPIVISGQVPVREHEVASGYGKFSFPFSYPKI